MNIIFSGSGEFGLPSLQALLAAGHTIVQLFTQPDRPAGRGKKLTPTPIGAYAEAHKLPVIKTANINLEPLRPADVMVVIAFGQKIGPHVVNHPRLGSVNLHASRLPKYRGAAPINWAILNGETTTGNSIIRLAEKMDAGAILARSQITIDPLEIAGEVHDRLAADGAPLLLEVLQDLSTGAAIEQPQDDSQATLAPKLNRQATIIDFSHPAAQICNQIRGLFPWPGCRVKLLDPDGKEQARVTLMRAIPQVASPTNASPGTIVGPDTIAVGNGSIQLLDLQPQGKRPMSLADFRNGHPWRPGMRLESIS